MKGRKDADAIVAGTVKEIGRRIDDKLVTALGKAFTVDDFIESCSMNPRGIALDMLPTHGAQ